MAKSTNIVKRNKPGRPVEIGADRFVGLRLPADLFRRIGAWAKREGIAKRSEAVRALIEKGLGK